MAAPLILWGTKTCPFVARALIVLNHKKIKHTFMELDLRKRRPSWFMQVSPYGKVPILQHGAKWIYESAALLQYLDECFPKNKLMSEDPYERAMERVWSHWTNTRFANSLYDLLFNKDARKEEALHQRVLNNIQFLEERLADTDGPFFFGKRFGFADAMIAPFFDRVQLVGTFKEVPVPTIQKHPRVVGLFRAINEVPAVQQSLVPLDELIAETEPIVHGHMQLKPTWSY